MTGQKGLSCWAMYLITVRIISPTMHHNKPFQVLVSFSAEKVIMLVRKKLLQSAVPSSTPLPRLWEGPWAGSLHLEPSCGKRRKCYNRPVQKHCRPKAVAKTTRGLRQHACLLRQPPAHPPRADICPLAGLGLSLSCDSYECYIGDMQSPK